MDTKQVGAGAFKQGCLALLDEVAERGVEIVITKRGKPVARLVPIESPRAQEEEVLQQLRAQPGRLLVSEEEFLAPSSEGSPWAAEE